MFLAPAVEVNPKTAKRSSSRRTRSSKRSGNAPCRSRRSSRRKRINPTTVTTAAKKIGKVVSTPVEGEELLVLTRSSARWFDNTCFKAIMHVFFSVIDYLDIIAMMVDR